MSSPFPGMDPFLEHPDSFPDLHGAMHVYIREMLQAVLPIPYFAVIQERLWVETSARFVEPDTEVIHGSRNSGGSEVSRVVLAAPARTEPLVFEVTDDECRQACVEIRTRPSDGDERVVTVIEVLSLSNKTPGAKGRELYLQKQQEILASVIHLVEIDLLRGGEHTTPVSRERLGRRAGPFDYHVSVRRFDEGGRFFVYPWTLETPFPEIAIPLLPGHGEVPLDLQAVFARCYETGPYHRRVVYDLARLVPPLPADKARWVEQILSQQASLG